MRILLIILCGFAFQAKAERKPILWQYPGPFGERLERAFENVETKREAHQLTTEKKRRAHLKTVIGTRSPTSCLEDDYTCKNSVLALLNELGLGGRVSATAKRTDLGYAITLKFESIEHETPKTFSAEAQTLDQAAREVLNALHGQGTLSLAITPNSAMFFLDDVPYGQGSGEHLITTGEYTLRIEAPGYKSETMPLKVQTGQRVRVSVLLAVAGARINLATKPAGATVFLDGERWTNYGELKTVPAGTHRLRVDLEGYNTFTQTLELKPNTVSELSLSLVPSDPAWRRALKQKVDATTALPAFIRGHFGLMSVRDRTYDLETDLGTLEKIDDPMSGQSFGFTISLRKAKWLLDVLRLNYTAATGPSLAKLNTDSDYELTDLTRMTIAPLWVGVQHPIWRIVPYAMAGVAFHSETLRGKKAKARFEGDQFELTVGYEMGVRYVFSDQFFAGFHHLMEGLPGSGNNVSFGIHAGFAFELPSILSEYMP